jgi:hypothetical protein
MRLLPPSDGANQHYLDEARLVLGIVQHSGPVRSVEDLRHRLTQPEKWVTDRADLAVLNAEVQKGQTARGRVWASLAGAVRPLEPYLSPTGWTYERLRGHVTIVPLSPVDAAQARLGDLMLTDLRRYMSDRLAAGDKRPMLVLVDEFPQLVTGASDPGDTAGSLFETARSAGLGLVLAAQSIAGLSGDETNRRRALSSGAALIIGRSKDPEDAVKAAGTVMRMESAGGAAGDELRTARAQHAYAIRPQEVREAWDGAFWLVQAGGVHAFRAMPAARNFVVERLAEVAAQSEPAHSPTEPPASPVVVNSAAEPTDDQDAHLPAARHERGFSVERHATRTLDEPLPAADDGETTPSSLPAPPVRRGFSV